MPLFARIATLDGVEGGEIVVRSKIGRSSSGSPTLSSESLLFALTSLAFTEMRNKLDAHKLVALDV